MITLRKFVKLLFFFIKAGLFLLIVLFLILFFINYFGPSLNLPDWIGGIATATTGPFSFLIYTGKSWRTFYSGRYDPNFLFNALLYLGLFIITLFMEERVIGALPGAHYLKKEPQEGKEQDKQVREDDTDSTENDEFNSGKKEKEEKI